MSTGILLTGIIMVIAMVAPFIFASRYKKNKYKKEKQSFIDLSNQKGLNIETPQIINDLVIGMDKSAKKLGVSSLKDINKDFRALDLSDFKTCEVMIGQAGADLQKIELVLKGTQKSEELLFYKDSNLDMPKMNFNESKDKANHWKAEIKPLL